MLSTLSADNGQRLVFDRLDAIHTMQAVAAGTLEESVLGDWFRPRIQPT